MDRQRSHSLLALWLLFGVNTLNFFDRQILAAVTEPLRREWGLSDTQLGWLITAFTLLYAAAGLPLGRLADVWCRKLLLALGLTLWSALTCASGLCRGFWSLFGVRLGVGVGEATCAPASASIIGDYFAAQDRARALSLFMLGLPAGMALSYVTSGTIAQRLGWRSAFFVAAIPGFLLVLLLLRLHEPPRGSAEKSPVGSVRRQGSPYLLILRIPTMWWIIASGALHNFNMYAITSFLPAFLIRYHQVTIETAGFISGVVIGVVGAMGMLLGGWLADRLIGRRANGRMLVAGIALLASVPALLFALDQPPGALVSFMLLQATASMMLYVYYPTIYATIQDILEPSLRGTGMALYLFAMYVLGAFLGPVGIGWASDYFAHRAMLRAGLNLPAVAPIPELFKATGLHQAMYLVPILGLVLAGVLFAGSATVHKDMERLQKWMAGLRPDPAADEGNARPSEPRRSNFAAPG